MVRTGDNSDTLVTVHSFREPYPEPVSVPLPLEGYTVSERFVPDGVSVLVEKDRLLVKGLAPYQALSVLLRK